MHEVVTGLGHSRFMTWDCCWAIRSSCLNRCLREMLLGLQSLFKASYKSCLDGESFRSGCLFAMVFFLCHELLSAVAAFHMAPVDENLCEWPVSGSCHSCWGSQWYIT